MDPHELYLSPSLNVSFAPPDRADLDVTALSGCTLHRSVGGRANNDPPTSSGPIALTDDDRFLWVVNPDNNSVSVIEVGGDANAKIAEIPVGEDPTSVAIGSKDKRVFVTN